MPDPGRQERNLARFLAPGKTQRRGWELIHRFISFSSMRTAFTLACASLIIQANGFRVGTISTPRRGKIELRVNTLKMIRRPDNAEASKRSGRTRDGPGCGGVSKNDGGSRLTPHLDAVEIGREKKYNFEFGFLGPRILLLGCSILYGTNFPLGRIMNDAMPASAATSSRLLLAALALSPFLPRLKPSLAVSTIVCTIVKSANICEYVFLK